MKKLIKIFTIFFFITTYMYAHESNTIKLTQKEKTFIKENPEIILGSGISFEPYIIKKENGSFTGYDKDIADLIEKETGLKINFEVGKWTEIQEKAKNREVDGLSTVIHTKDREKYYHFTSPYIETSTLVLVGSGNPKKIYSKNDFLGKKISVQEGNKLFTKLAKSLDGVEIVYYPSQDAVLKAVISKEVDFTILNEMIFYVANKMGLRNFVEHSFVIGKSVPFRFALRNDKPELISIINKALDKLDSNEVFEIREKWFSVPKKELTSIEFTASEKAYIENKQKVIIANELDFIPYDYNEDDIAKGFVIDYAKLVFNKIGIEVVFVEDKWKTLYKNFLDNKIDILPILTYSSERDKILKYTKSYFKHQMSIITKKDRFNIVNIDDLNGKSIAVPKGWNSTKFIKKYHPEIILVEYENLDSILNAVNNNLVEASILDELTASYYINKQYKNTLKIVTTTTIRNFNPKIYMGVNNDNEILRDIINKTMKTITKKDIQILHSKWLNITKGLTLTKEEEEFIEKTTLNIITTSNWAPFVFLNKKNEMTGISQDFWNYITNKTNLKTNMTPSSNFTKSLQAIKEKKQDVIISTSSTKDREEYGIFSNIYHTSKIGIATLKDKNFIQKMSFLNGKKVGVGKNYTTHQLLLKNYPKIDLVPVKNVEEGLDLLANNKIYAFADIMPVLTHNITHGSYTNLKISGKTDLDFNLSVMIRDDYPLLQSIVNKAIQSMPEAKKDEILNKWLNAEVDIKFDYSILWQIVGVFTIIILLILYKNRQMLKYQTSLEEIKIKLEKKNIELESLIQEAPNPIMVHNENGKVLIVNKVWLNITQYLFDDINTIDKWTLNAYGKRGKNLQSYIDNLYEVNKRVDEGEFIINTKNGDKRVWQFSSVPFGIIDGKKAVISSAMDITELRDKDKILLQQSKMASIGEMLENIAHQWRQPLSSISTASTGVLLEQEAEILKPESLKKSMNSINEAAQYLSKTIDYFREFLINSDEKKLIRIKNSVEKTLGILSSKLKNRDIYVLSEIEDIDYKCIENELIQVIMNILSNSQDALEKCGNKKLILINIYKERDNIVFVIKDSAGGIDESIIDKIYEPYFTTKHQSQGTGIGLYMTENIIVKYLNGTIKVKNRSFEFENNSYLGAEFVIKLPLNT